MFDAAEMKEADSAKALAGRMAADIHVSMAHASSEHETPYIKKEGKFKSRIGGAASAESGALTVPGSQPATRGGAAAGSLNSQQAKEVGVFLDTKYSEPATTEVSHQDWYEHLKSTQEEAKERRNNKLTNQLKKDTDHLPRSTEDSERLPAYHI